MDEDDPRQAPRAHEDETDVPAEDGGEGELEERAQEGGEQRRARVREGELVEMVDVGDTKVERSEENGARGGKRD